MSANKRAFHALARLPTSPCHKASITGCLSNRFLTLGGGKNLFFICKINKIIMNKKMGYFSWVSWWFPWIPWWFPWIKWWFLNLQRFHRSKIRNSSRKTGNVALKHLFFIQDGCCSNANNKDIPRCFKRKQKIKKKSKTSLRISSPSDPAVVLSPGKIPDKKKMMVFPHWPHDLSFSWYQRCPRTLKRVVAIRMRQQDVGSRSHMKKIPCMKTWYVSGGGW